MDDSWDGKILLDVGGYKGHSVLAALDPIIGFDRGICFEPSPLCARRIRRIKDPRLVVVQAGLANEDGVAHLFHSGTLAGSLFEDAPSYTEGALDKEEVVDVKTLGAARFYGMLIGDDDRVWMKLNCEGAEMLVLSSLLHGGQLGLIANALIDLNALKIHSRKSKA